MRDRYAKLRGTTLTELLVAVVVLGACASIILGAVVTGKSRATYAKRRALALALCCDQIESARSQSLLGNLTAGTTVTPVSLPGSVSVTVTTVSSLVSGYTNLYQVVSTATWNEGASARPDLVTLTTLMRSPDA